VTRSEREPAEEAVRIRRILVALDASSRSLEALENAAELAARWKAELLGLFVEDEDLLRLAAAASATHFLFPAASEEPLSGMHMERELKALAEAARRELARAAAHSHVSWSFRIVRGHLPTEILLAAAESDLLSLSLGGAGWPMGRRFRFGSTVWRSGEPITTSLPILVVCDGSPGAVEACRLAAQLAGTYGSRLTVLVPTPSGRLDPQEAAELSSLLGGATIPIRFRATHADDKTDFLRAVQSESGGVLVLSGRSPLLEEEMIDALMRETDKPLLIVGGRPGPAPGDTVVTQSPGKA
jgi:nucleotide-binding universal stress UspA family protein